MQIELKIVCYFYKIKIGMAFAYYFCHKESLCGASRLQHEVCTQQAGSAHPACFFLPFFPHWRRVSLQPQAPARRSTSLPPFAMPSPLPSIGNALFSLHIKIPRSIRENPAAWQTGFEPMNEQELYEELQDFFAKGQKGVFFENPFIGITITDGNGLILCVNPSQSRITGTNKSVWVGHDVHNLSDSGMLINSGTLKVFESGKAETLHQSVSNGNSFFVQSHPVRDPEGNLRYVISYLVDVSELNELREELNKVRFEKQEIARTLDFLRNKISQERRMIYASKEIQSLVSTMDLVADSDTSVLITGASGVGKEVIARELHEKSRRRDQPFVKISCEAIPATLLESELFGYEPGSFTGAGKKGKPGLFEEGHKGTVFLDEIGEIPPELQVKLLQVLQERAVRRIGGTKKTPVDIRIIAATNANLRQMIKEKRFREDLFYRLNVIPLHVPDLDKRREDIPLLAQHFIAIFNEQYGKNKFFSIDAAAYLTNLKYDGNVRQLRNLVERAILLSPRETISLEDIRAVYEMKEGHEAEEARPSLDKPLQEIMEEQERKVLQAYWGQYGNTSAIARLLKVSQPTISRKLKKYNIGQWVPQQRDE